MSLQIKSRKNSAIAAVEKAIEEQGPMSRAELERATGKALGSTLSRLSDPNGSGPNSPQRLHIIGWCFDHEDDRRYPRAIYDIGPGPNKPKPAPKGWSARNRKYRDVALKQVAGVFELGLPVSKRFKLTAQRRSVLSSQEPTADQPTQPDCETSNS